MQKEDLFIYSNSEELAWAFADQFMDWIQDFKGENYHLAISGGKTPNLMFNALADKYVNSPLWQKVHVWWVDERMVPPTDPESNFGVAQKLLFSRISIPEEHIHRIKGENNPENEALSYSEQIKNHIQQEDEWPVFDLILLGMGDDGHTASIFPNQLGLLTSKQICEVATHPATGQKRVTLTGKAINSASKIIFLVTGKEKAERISEIFNQKPEAELLPAFYINNPSWIIDEEASRLIE